MRTIYKTVITCFFLLLFIQPVNAQEYWHRVKGGLGQVGTGETVISLLNDTVNHLLYASGNFNETDDTIGCSGVVNWDGQNWTKNTNFNANPSTKVLGYFQSKIFIGTTNQNTGNVAYNLSGTTWASAGYMNDGGVSCLCVYHNKLYVGGDFTNVDGIQATLIACYDGANWSEPGGGIWCTQFPGDVSAMCVWNDKLIVGGSFDQAGGVTVHSVAAWNDTAWSDVGGGVIDNLAPTQVAYLYSICVHSNNLIVAGNLTENSDGTTLGNHIIGYNGINWFPLGGGIDAHPFSLYSWDSVLYVGGPIGLSSDYIKKWENSQWSTVGDNILLGVTYSFAVYDSILYAGGVGMKLMGIMYLE